MYSNWKWNYKNGMVNKPIYRLALLGFLYAVVSGMVAYILPVLLEEKVKSEAVIGIILASSSLWNMLVDMVIGLMKKPPSYVWILRMVGASLVAIFGSLFISLNIVTLIGVTVLWGIYTELYSFAIFDFIQALSDDEEKQAFDFGILTSFGAVGFFIAPILAAYLIVADKNLALFTGLYLALAFLVVFNLFVMMKRLPKSIDERKRRMSFWAEMRIWKEIGKKMKIALGVSLLRGISDGALLSFVPIMAMNRGNLIKYGGLIMASFDLPVMISSGFFGKMATDKKRRRKLIWMGMMIAGMALLGFGFSDNVILSCLLAIAVGLGLAMVGPSVSALQSVYIAKHKSQECRVVGETGLYYNVGFIVGSIACGVLLTLVSNFGIVFGIFGTLYLGMGWWVGRKT